ncbi:hypothetical protein [Demequina rhizosphaerae]|uniref:hypothetical protein n=1 Tax=Demequina rhizosphaerae TaxID=1638985 RepID=UPI00078189DA|nr:hypothetical protein [Demequina rhizosphaerae]
MTDDDPFASRPGNQTPPPPASSPPPPPSVPGTPGIIPGAAPPPAPAYGTGPEIRFDRTGAPLEKPEGLAKGLIGVTAGFTVLTVFLAVMARSEADSIREAAETGDFAISVASLLGLFSTPLMVVSYILYGMWMSRMRRNREAMGTRPGLPAVEWWGWFVPIASAVLVPLGARKVTGRAVPLSLVLGWWIMWVLAQAATAYASVAANFSLDFTTGELTNPELLDSYPMWMWISAAFTVVSWWFLFRFIRAATDRHLDAEA